jgi:hypothetical protein
MSDPKQQTPVTQSPVIRAILVHTGNVAHTRQVLYALTQQTLPLDAIALVLPEAVNLGWTPEQLTASRIVTVNVPSEWGFAQQANTVIREWWPQADALWLLDSEPKPFALQALWANLMAADGRGLVSAAVMLGSATMTRAYQVNPVTGKLIPLGMTRMNTPAVDVLSRHSLLVPKTVWQQLGLLDERLHKFWEAVDLCQRAKQHNIPLLFEPKAVVRIDKPVMAQNAWDSFYLVRNRWWILGPSLAWWQRLTFLAWDGWTWFGLLLTWLKHYNTPHAKGHYELVRLYWWGVYQGMHPFPPRIQ